MEEARAGGTNLSDVRRIFPVVLAVLALGFGPSDAVPFDPCAPRLLVLSAVPGEIDPLLSEADVADTVVLDGRSFFVGTLRGHDVVLALTGIGLVNAETTTRAAFEHFACGSATSIAGVVVSGVSGGRTNIGDVSVPHRWTEDGQTWFAVDPAMFAAAGQAADAEGDVEGQAAGGDGFGIEGVCFTQPHHRPFAKALSQVA